MEKPDGNSSHASLSLLFRLELFPFNVLTHKCHYRKFVEIPVLLFSFSSKFNVVKCQVILVGEALISNYYLIIC